MLIIVIKPDKAFFMFRHNIKLALRNIKKNILYSIINIGGLAIGLASFIFIILYINDELSYDKYHKNYDRIYRIAVLCVIPIGYLSYLIFEKNSLILLKRYKNKYSTAKMG